MTESITFKTLAVYNLYGIFSMGKVVVNPAVLLAALSSAFLLAVLFVGPCASQGMGASKAYDQNGYDYMGTPVYSAGTGEDQADLAASGYLTGYLNPYSSEAVGISSSARPSALGLQMDESDPAASGLSTSSSGAGSANQLYLQSGSLLTESGTVSMGDSYVLWARAGGKGSFILYDYGQQILSRAVTPGWYRIQGAYGSFAGQHLYRFFLVGQASNNVTVMVSSAGYPTSYSLTGRVLDGSGQGLAGVAVTATNSDGGRFSTTTGQSGYYAIDVASGVYVISGQLAGYVFTQTTAQAVSGLVSAARPIVGTPAGGPVAAPAFPESGV